jgi:hypothetical protein
VLSPVMTSGLFRGDGACPASVSFLHGLQPIQADERAAA